MPPWTYETMRKTSRGQIIRIIDDDGNVVVEGVVTADPEETVRAMEETADNSDNPEEE